MDLEKIRELMEKTDGWEESKQQEFYGYLLEEKDNFFKSSFGDLFLELYEQKLGSPDVEIIRQRHRRSPEPERKAGGPRSRRVLPVLLLVVAVSAGSIWTYRKVEALDAKRHLEALQETMQGKDAGRMEPDDDRGQTQGTTGMQSQAGETGTGSSAAGGIQGNGRSDGAEGSDWAGTADGAQGAPENAAPPVLAGYRELSAQYPELFGWLTVPDSGISYPVMQPAAEKDYYLHHNYRGTPDDEGALFVDPASGRYPMDDNLVIYGHNMKNGHMFGELKNYGVKSYFLEHQEISFDTIYESGSYEVVTVVQTHIRDESEEGFRYYRFFNYETEEAFQECVDFIQENQIYDMENKLQYGDQLLMLSTCDYAQDNGRFVVIARKKEG